MIDSRTFELLLVETPHLMIGTDRVTAVPSAALVNRPQPALAKLPERSAPVQPSPRKVTGLTASLETLSMYRKLIAALAAAGFALGLFYTTQMCVPLYRVQASLELRPHGEYADTLARVLQSQSLMGSALSSLPETEQAGLGTIEKLRQRLHAIATPSGQVVDVELLSANRPAAPDFVNALLQETMQRNRDVRSMASSDEYFNIAVPAAESITILDPASASTLPVSPSLSLNLALSTILGAGGGVIFVLLRHFAARTFAGPGSLGRVLGVRELGAMPERKLLAAPGAEVIAGALDPNDESLRCLRSSLLYQPGQREIRCLAFTSAAPGEGKTTVVTNLGMSLAATGRRVLLIDGDLRRPRVHKLLQVQPGPGLADLLRREPGSQPAPLSRYVFLTSFQNLYVLPPGTAGNDAPELLASRNLPQLMRELSKSFDFVLIDTPPLLACADARSYGRAAEGVVLVVRASETQKRAALAARDIILQDGSTIIGTVLTGWRQAYPAYTYPAG